jgi:acyl-CoA reductase-like NAD-dependent aldehyde dehydrogenase
MARAKTISAPTERSSVGGRASLARASAKSEGPAEWPRADLAVRKAFKMYVNGAFVRSESGRYLQVEETLDPQSKGTRENIPRGSRKDARDAVLAAHGAFAGWSKRVAFNRGQILYRLAEMLDARKGELVRSLVRSGVPESLAEDEVAESTNRALAYSGWADKFQAVLSSFNPVGGPHFDFTLPEPMGVVAIAAPPRPSLLGLVGAMAPVIVSGNTCVILASERDPRTALVFGELLATSDLPGGVVNILSGHVKETLVPLSRHMEVAALDLHDVEPGLVKEVAEHATDSVKRVRVRNLTEKVWFDHDACTSPMWIEKFLEFKTIWHPSGG